MNIFLIFFIIFLFFKGDLIVILNVLLLKFLMEILLFLRLLINVFL